ncbi:MAG: hypothetical protein GY899_16105, partial [Verrucomicrobiaceae bacterium]|nr:hypothetical protein [Verrucomicrobiaceae bacterium]
MTEDDGTTPSGTLTISDADDGDSPAFTAASATASTGGYGTYTVTSGGLWTYTQGANMQGLNADESASDTFSVGASDGTSQTVTITLTGANDASSIGGTSTGAMTEDDGTTPSGTLTISDADDGDSPAFTAVSSATASAGGYGTYTVTSGGLWTYTQGANMQGLNADESASDTFTVG